MKLTDRVFVLPIPRDAEDGASQFNPTLIIDEANGHTLVDAGFPGQREDIGAELVRAGLEAGDLGRIILTHQDLDHTGAAAELARESGAEVLAHPEDTPYIDGSRRPLKPSPEILEQRPHMREIFDRLEPVRVDGALSDGSKLDLAGSTQVIFTPGHTPGHTSLYLQDEKILIAGDALTAEDGTLHGPNPPVTLDMPTALQSVQKLADIASPEVQTIVCYHGGLVTQDASGQLRRLANESSS